MRTKKAETEDLITRQMLVGLTASQGIVLEMVATAIGMKTSQYLRQLAIERLVQLKLIENPMAKFEKPITGAATTVPAE
jgi:hypothetical protein